MSLYKKFSWKGTLRQVFICLNPPPVLGFCLGWSSNFVGSQSGQIQSVKIPQNMSPTGFNTPPPPPRGRVQSERGLEGQQFTKLVENTSMTECISSL